MWAQANHSSPLCVWAARHWGGTRHFSTRGPVCWSVPWPEAAEVEGLTRIPSGECDFAHAGRVVKKVSIAGLSILSVIVRSDEAHSTIFLQNGETTNGNIQFVLAVTTQHKFWVENVLHHNFSVLLLLFHWVFHCQVDYRSLTLFYNKDMATSTETSMPQPATIHSSVPPSPVFPTPLVIHEGGKNSAGPLLKPHTFQILIKIAKWPPVQASFNPFKTFWH